MGCGIAFGLRVCPPPPQHLHTFTPVSPSSAVRHTCPQRLQMPAVRGRHTTALPNATSPPRRTADCCCSSRGITHCCCGKSGRGTAHRRCIGGGRPIRFRTWLQQRWDRPPSLRCRGHWVSNIRHPCCQQGEVDHPATARHTLRGRPRRTRRKGDLPPGAGGGRRTTSSSQGTRTPMVPGGWCILPLFPLLLQAQRTSV